jgi:perosamine synthetase
VTSAILPYGRQCIDDDDIEAVTRVLRSDYLTTGPEVEAFEAELASACGARYAVVVSSGTAALHCAYHAAGIGPGDEVITSPLTFSATANMALALGARPIFADIDPETLCLDPQRVACLIGPKTRVLSPVDFAGHPAEMDRFTQLGRQHDLVVLEDAAHALGSTWRGKAVGSLADMTIFSFHPVKTITAGEGGAVVTDSAKLAQRARDFRNHGLVREAERMHASPEPWSYEIQSLGFNYRLSAIHCALGRAQLSKLNAFVRRRAQIVERYLQAFVDTEEVRVVQSRPEAMVAWHLFTLQLRAGKVARSALFQALLAQNIRPQVHYECVNAMPLYRDLGHDPDDTPIARDVSQSLISLPLYPAMNDGDVERVIDAVTQALTTSGLYDGTLATTF